MILITLIAPPATFFDTCRTQLFIMTIETTITGVEERDATDGTNHRRRITDIAQPLDYVAQELVGEFVESQQRTAAPQQSFIKKLLSLD